MTVKDGVRFLDAATGKTGNLLEEKGSEPLAVAYLPFETERAEGSTLHSAQGDLRQRPRVLP